MRVCFFVPLLISGLITMVLGQESISYPNLNGTWEGEHEWEGFHAIWELKQEGRSVHGELILAKMGGKERFPYIDEFSFEGTLQKLTQPLRDSYVGSPDVLINPISLISLNQVFSIDATITTHFAEPAVRTFFQKLLSAFPFRSEAERSAANQSVEKIMQCIAQPIKLPVTLYYGCSSDLTLKVIKVREAFWPGVGFKLVSTRACFKENNYWELWWGADYWWSGVVLAAGLPLGMVKKEPCKTDIDEDDRDHSWSWSHPRYIPCQGFGIQGGYSVYVNAKSSKTDDDTIRIHYLSLTVNSTAFTRGKERVSASISVVKNNNTLQRIGLIFPETGIITRNPYPATKSYPLNLPRDKRLIVPKNAKLLINGSVNVRTNAGTCPLGNFKYEIDPFLPQ